MSKAKSSTPSVVGQISLPRHVRNICGKRFGRLVVVGFAGLYPPRHTALWLCLCDCGKTKTTQTIYLREGTVRSCGCLHDENLTHGIRTTHGQSYTPMFKIWSGIKNRCYNKKEPMYPYYGGRGIRVCDRWRNSFTAFLADMGKRPTSKHQLDRFPDNNGDYRPGNCRWVIRKYNMRNKRSNRRLAFDGKSLCVSEWAELTGICFGTIHSRLARGWSIEQALTSPVEPLSVRAKNFSGRNHAGALCGSNKNP